MTVKTKIPPPLIALIAVVAMWFVANSPIGAPASSDHLLVLAIVFAATRVTIAVPALFVLAITELQIKPEEVVLEKLIGNDYENYRNTVRRWI